MSLLRILTSALILLNLAVLSGCGSERVEPAQPERIYFDRAQKALDSKNYEIAIRLLEEIERRYPFGQYTTQAQADLIFAYFKRADYGASEAAAERFTDLHPNHPNTDYAYYMKAVTIFPAIYLALNKTNRRLAYRRDIEAGRKSFFLLGAFIQRFPDSLLVADARQRMVYIRSLLAKHEISVSAFYFKRRAYVASLRRAQGVLTEYPQTVETADALSLIIASHYKLGQDDNARKTIELLRMNYPEHPSLDENGEYQIPQPNPYSALHKMTKGFFYRNEGEMPELLYEVSRPKTVVN